MCFPPYPGKRFGEKELLEMFTRRLLKYWKEYKEPREKLYNQTKNAVKANCKSIYRKFYKIGKSHGKKLI